MPPNVLGLSAQRKSSTRSMARPQLCALSQVSLNETGKSFSELYAVLPSGKKRLATNTLTGFYDPDGKSVPTQGAVGLP